MEPKIIFEDSEILVLDKPAGMVVNRAESVKGMTIQEWVEKKFEIYNLKFETDSEEETFVNRAGIVHRLDKETSGLLLVAKTSEAFALLQAQFAKREVKKKYTALVHGIVVDDGGRIEADLARLPWNRERFGVVDEGRNSVTEYEVIKRYQREATQSKQRKFPGRDFGFTLLELRPLTGRTHQIRVHLKSIGHPVVADEFYAGRKTAREDRTWCPRLFLHAKEISFRHPVSGETVTFVSQLPDELNMALGKIMETKE